MNASIGNGRLRKWLSNAVPAGVVPEHTVDSGGEVRLTSSWSRQFHGVRAASGPTWVARGVRAGSRASPSTPGHLPRRLSKLWFSS